MIAQIKIIVKIIAKVLVFVGLGGCIAWPVSKKGVIGTYQSVLQDGTVGFPNGGTEILELKSDDTCIQVIQLKNGRTLTAQGTWEWWPDKKCYLGNGIIVTGIYWTIHKYENIDSDLEKSLGNVVQSLPVGRTLTGRVMLGSDEGSHYEKK